MSVKLLVIKSHNAVESRSLLRYQLSDFWLTQPLTFSSSLLLLDWLPKERVYSLETLASAFRSGQIAIRKATIKL